MCTRETHVILAFGEEELLLVLLLLGVKGITQDTSPSALDRYHTTTRIQSSIIQAKNP